MSNNGRMIGTGYFDLTEQQEEVMPKTVANREPLEEQKCRRCDQTKPNFEFQRSRLGIRFTICKMCMKELAQHGSKPNAVVVEDPTAKLAPDSAYGKLEAPGQVMSVRDWIRLESEVSAIVLAGGSLLLRHPSSDHLVMLTFEGGATLEKSLHSSIAERLLGDKDGVVYW